VSKPRFGAQVDTVQPAIVAALEQAGAKVLVLDVGEEGAPDLAVLWLGHTTLMELKSAKGRLEPEQRRWHEGAARRGVRVHICRTPREALEAVGIVGELAEANLRATREMARAFQAEQRRTEKQQAAALGAQGRMRSSVRRPA